MKTQKKAVVDIKQEYERIQRDEEAARLATEKEISEMLTKRGYQYLATVNIMGANIPLDQIINPALVVSLRLVAKPKG